MLVSTSGLYFLTNKSTNQSLTDPRAECIHPEKEIPIIQDVDALILGGGAGAIAAAVEIANTGAKPFVVTRKPYLGEDICGTYNLWSENTPNTPLAKQLLNTKKPPHPFYIKKILDKTLIDHHINFLYNSYISNILVDESNHISGAVIINCTGEQAIRSKVIIDATPRATAARMTGAKTAPFFKGKHTFHFITAGNQALKKEGVEAEKLTPGISVIEDPNLPAKEYPAWKFSADINMKDNSFSSFAKAEQLMRDLTWDKEQVDCADDLIYVSPDFIVGEESCRTQNLNIEGIPIESCRPKDKKGIYILGECIDISRKAALQLTDPVNIIEFGTRIGKTVAKDITSVKTGNKISILSSSVFINMMHTPQMTYSFIRSSMMKGKIPKQQMDIPVLGQFDVLVVGGGSSGSAAAISAARNGARTLCIEHLHGLGGLTTKGLIEQNHKTHEPGFAAEVINEIKKLRGEPKKDKVQPKQWCQNWKMEWLRKEFTKAGGKLWFGAIGCGAIVEFRKVKGAVIITPFGKGIIWANTIIDATGNADIAIAAGAQYQHSPGKSMPELAASVPVIKNGQQLVYSECTFVENTDIFDIQRTLVTEKIHHEEAYDIGELIYSEERRKINGEQNISALDIFNNRTYPDTISIQKGIFKNSEYTSNHLLQLKAPLYSETKIQANIPLRSLLPKGLDSIVVTGHAIGIERNAASFQCNLQSIQNQGYTIGLAAAMVAPSRQSIRKISLKKLQKKLSMMGYINEKMINDNFPPGEEQLIQAAKKVDSNYTNIEKLLWNKNQGIQFIKTRMQETKDHKAELAYAHALGIYGYADGWKILYNKVDSITSWEKEEDTEEKDTKKKKKNQNNTMPKPKGIDYLDSLIIALGNTRHENALPVILEKAALLTAESKLSHFLAISLALENFQSPEAAQMLYNILEMPGMMKHDIPTIETAIEYAAAPDETNTNHPSLREYYLGRALLLCGDHERRGKAIMKKYARDLRGFYAKNACEVLSGNYTT